MLVSNETDCGSLVRCIHEQSGCWPLLAKLGSPGLLRALLPDLDRHVSYVWRYIKTATSTMALLLTDNFTIFRVRLLLR